MEKQNSKTFIFLMIFICIILIIQTVLLFIFGLNSNLLFSYTSPQKTFYVEPTLTSTMMSEIKEISSLPETKTIIEKCSLSPTPQPEIWSNLDAYYFDKEDNARICGIISEYSIVEEDDVFLPPKLGKLHLTLEKYQDIDYPIDIFLNIPVKLNKSVYSFLMNNVNSKICFSGKKIYTSGTKIIYELENISDLCIP